MGPCGVLDERSAGVTAIEEDPVCGIMPVIKDQITFLRRHNA
jgi:hypothetical protein